MHFVTRGLVSSRASVLVVVIADFRSSIRRDECIEVVVVFVVEYLEVFRLLVGNVSSVEGQSTKLTTIA